MLFRSVDTSFTISYPSFSCDLVMGESIVATQSVQYSSCPPSPHASASDVCAKFITTTKCGRTEGLISYIDIFLDVCWYALALLLSIGKPVTIGRNPSLWLFPFPFLLISFFMKYHWRLPAHTLYLISWFLIYTAKYMRQSDHHIIRYAMTNNPQTEFGLIPVE